MKNQTQSSPVFLKPITAADLDAVVELDRVCLGGLWTKAGYQRELDSPNSELWAIARSPQQPQSLIALGCFWAILEEAHITLLAVAPAYRRQGLGRLLLATLLQQAQKRGLERATLEVRCSNQAAIALYQKFGFKIAGTRKKYYQDNQEDALILWLGGLSHYES
ncbi:MAG: ribosomal protein S18-alanine N-acetyltransferase [Jaaginema sp. PMC 1079.18]|nr:ribosomal protein S18-alanine N-acetyltransferase [Jaaginema sp. PMC 1080.18]MEC4852312.1 ribosomal protein S18-alanine N-acetyltransferase [Jaaginema sp. PMC 1079.18]MEC4868464.1 ribosomal protein S18-alanine N-acetyltransferase [Jaaginema sp. PMC 1078.18]